MLEEITVRTEYKILKFLTSRYIKISGLSLLSIIILISAFLCLYWKDIEGKLENTINAVLGETETKYGIHISKGRIELGFSGIVIPDVSMDGKISLTAKSVLVFLNFNPFTCFAEPFSEIRVEGIKAGFSLSDIRDISRLLAGMKKNNESTSDDKADPPLSRKIPGFVKLDFDRFELTDPEGKTALSIHELKAAFDRGRFLFDIKFESIQYGEKTFTGKTDLKLFLKNVNDEYLVIFSILDEPGTLSRMDGNFHFSRDLRKTRLFAKNIGFPDELSFLIPKTITNASTLKYSAGLELDFDEKYEVSKYNLALVSANLHLNHSALAESEIGPIPFEMNLSGQVNLKKGFFNISNGELGLAGGKDEAGEKPFRIKFELDNFHYKKDFREQNIDALISLEKTPCNSILQGISQSLIPKISGFRLSGDAGFSSRIKIDLKNPSGFSFTLENFEYSCEVALAPEEYSRERLMAAFPDGEGEKNISVRYGTGRLAEIRYVPLGHISRMFQKTVISSEDAAFWTHKGIDTESLLVALRINLQERKAAMGGSTITQQVVKNLFLSQDKSLSRKI
ncbi:MAG: transglycosylase domain-containing protein, partial [Oligoflexales bacterium]|nr:transglycosylase domain-containing protein [Oligoflexales bacterium]